MGCNARLTLDLDKRGPKHVSSATAAWKPGRCVKERRRKRSDSRMEWCLSMKEERLLRERKV